MSLKTIIRKIEEEAAGQSQEILKEANADAEQILMHAHTKAEQEAAQIKQHNEEELHTLKNKQKATTLLQLRKKKLDNRQQILGDVFTAALQQLQELDDEQGRAIIKTILLSAMENRQGTLVFSKKDAQLVDQQFLDDIHAELDRQERKKLRFELSKETAPIERGFVIDFKDFELNCSFQEILKELWADIEGDVSTRLFGTD